MIEKVRQILNESNNVVVLSGSKLAIECGIVDIRGEEIAYDIELKYGFSPEEILTPIFLTRRADIFYKYYKENVLQLDKLNPSKAHEAIVELERKGKLRTIITRNVYELHQKAGSHSIIELHGNINSNKCTICGRYYTAEYMANSKGIPKCEHCQVMLHPGIALFGDSIDNGKMTQAAQAVADADVLLLVGANATSPLANHMIKYYKNNKFILINDEKHPSDKRANYCLYGKCKDILPQIIM